MIYFKELIVNTASLILKFAYEAQSLYCLTIKSKFNIIKSIKSTKNYKIWGKKMANDVADNYNHYLNLRNTYDTFIYHGYNITLDNETLIINYSFEIKNLKFFTASWEFRCKNKEITKNKAFNNAVFYLGMVELVSYFKITCAKKIIIKCKNIDEFEINWWKKLYFNGLSEFYYRNNILQNDKNLSYNNMTEIICENINADTNHYSDKKYKLRGCLIPIGGGKDSAVSLEILKDKFDDSYAYIINRRGATFDTAKTYGLDDEHIYCVKRTLDKGMLELNSKGFLNGHTPFSAIVAFSSIISAMLCGKKYIVLSNEASADENTVIDLNVNHQYSKSYEFERDFISYEKKYIDSSCYYFSLLRPLCELQIAKIFSEKCQKYFKIFKSCNVGSKKDIWCCKCSKCLFVYLITAPFINDKTLMEIFGNNLADDETLISDFDRLIGLKKEKPFECVGSIDEINTAIRMKLDIYRKENEKLPFLYSYYVKRGLDKSPYNKNKFLDFYNNTNALPKEFNDFVSALLKKGQ